MNRLIAFFHALSIVVAVIAILYAFIIFTGLLFGCVALSQEEPTIHVEPAMRFPEAITNASSLFTNAPNAPLIIERRSAMPPVPPLPPAVLRSITTNEGKRVTATVKVEDIAPQPPPLVRKSWREGNFWVACPGCDGEAIRKPSKIRTVKIKPLNDEDEEHEYLITTRCNGCQQDFNFRYVRRVSLPVGVPVLVPVK